MKAERLGTRPQLKVYWSIRQVSREGESFNEDGVKKADRNYIRVESLKLPELVFDDVILEGYGETLHFLGGFRFGYLELEMVESVELQIIQEMTEV